MKKENKIVLLVVLLLLAISIIMGTFFIKVFNNINLSGEEIKNIAQKYFEENNFDCSIYCEVESKELIEKGYVSEKDIDSNLLITLSVDNGKRNYGISLLSATTGEVISGYKTTVTQSKGTNSNANITFGENNESIEITGDYSYASLNYTVSGLEVDKVYIATINVTTENIEMSNSKSGLGVHIWNKVVRETVATSSISNNSIKSSTTSDLVYVFTPLENGTIVLNLKMGDTGTNTIKGKVTINSFKIKEADDSLKMGTTSNGLITSVFWKEDVESAGVSEEYFNSYLKTLNDAYEAYADLTGHTDNSDELLYPLNKKKLFIFYTNEVSGAAAIAGFPIQRSRHYALDLDLPLMKVDRASFSIFHEMAHVFTTFRLVNDDYDSSKIINFDTEGWAQLLPFYLLDEANMKFQGVYSYGSFTKSNIWYDFDTLMGALDTQYKNVSSQSVSEYRGGNGYLAYLLLQDRHKEGLEEIDWEAWKQAFKWYNDVPKDIYNTYHLSYWQNRFLWFAKKLDEYSDDDIRAHFDDSNLKMFFDVWKLDYLPFTSININNEFLDTSTKKLDIALEPSKYWDVLVYDTNNPLVKIDDFGNITVDKSLEEGTKIEITARSFLHPSVTTTKEIIYGNPSIEAEIPDFYTYIIDEKEIPVKINYIDSSSRFSVNITDKTTGYDVTETFNAQIKDINIDESTKTGTAKLTMSANKLNNTGSYTLKISVNGQAIKEVEFKVVDPPYETINTAEELLSIKDNMKGFYRLGQDIDLSSYETFTIEGNESFKGLLEGNNYSIKGLKSSNGLFKTIDRGMIKNLKIENAIIDNSSEEDNNVVGILAETVKNKGYIYNVSTSGVIKGKSGIIGGIVGKLEGDSEIDQCYNSADIEIEQSAFEVKAGGIVGNEEAGRVSKVFNTGYINITPSETESYLGGIIGYINHIKSSGWSGVSQAYNVGEITVNNKNEDNEKATREGIAYINCSSETNKISMNYIYVAEELGLEAHNDSICASNNNNRSKAIKTMDELKNQSTYSYYDFKNTWEILNETLPTLKNNKYYYTSSITPTNEKITLRNNKTYDINEYLNIEPTNPNATNSKLEYKVKSGKGIDIDSTGKITTTKAGEGVITVSAKDGSHIEKDINIEVIEPKITISEKRITKEPIYNNNSETITLDVTTENISDGTNLDIKIKDGNEEVKNAGFQISGGNVQNNKATIEITTPSKLEIDADKTYKIVISNENVSKEEEFVIKKYHYIEEIELNDGEDITMDIGESKDLKIEIVPESATNKEVNCQSDSETVINFNNKTKTILAKNSGKALITCEAADGSEVSKSINVYVNTIKLGMKATVEDSDYISGKLTNKPVKVTLSVTNIDEEDITYKYSFDNEEWLLYTNSTTFSDINKKVYFKAVDSEGNESNIINITINSDITPPNMIVSYKKYKDSVAEDNGYIGTLLEGTKENFDNRITLYVKTDEEDATIKYQLYDDKDEKIKDETITDENTLCSTCNYLDLTKNIEYKLEVQVQDKAGNINEKTYNLSIDNHIYNINVTIKNGVYKGKGIYENETTFVESLDTREEETRYSIEPDEHYEYKGDSITCSNDLIKTDYSEGELILKDYSSIEEDIECSIDFEEIDYELEVVTDENGEVEGIEDNIIKQTHSEIKTYTLKQNKGYIYKSFMCDNANVSYDSDNNNITISEVTGNGVCTYETQPEETDNPVIEEIKPYLKNETQDKYDSDSWVNKRVKVDVVATDKEGTGIKEIWYKTGKDSEWKKYTDDVDFENVNETVYFKVIDYSNNESEIHTVIIKSDTITPTRPKINSIIDGTNDIYLPSKFTNKKITITLNSIDKGSGIRTYQYKLGNKSENLSLKDPVSNKNNYIIKRLNVIEQEWIDIKDNKITLSDINDIIYFRAIDNAGNISPINSLSINSDTTKLDNVDKSENENNNSNKTGTENNPKTGQNLSIMVLFTIFILGISIIAYIRKKNKFPNV